VTTRPRETPAGRAPVGRPAPGGATARPREVQVKPVPLTLDLPNFKCFGCSAANEYGLNLQFFRKGVEVVCDYTPPKHLQGWYGTVHGGILCTLLDELGSWAVTGLRRRIGMTRDVVVHYRRPVYVEEPIHLAATLGEEQGPLVKVIGRIGNQRGDLCVEGEITVFMLEEPQFARMVPDGQVPPALKPYFPSASPAARPLPRR